MEHTKILAVAGKGGVGKTSIAAVMVKILAKREKRAKRAEKPDRTGTESGSKDRAESV